MMEMDQIRRYFPPYLAENPNYQKYLLKEYLQLLILDFLSNSRWLPKLSFIGGTHLRLIKKIDRFSEDLDFDCKNLQKDEFIQMSDEIIRFLTRFGYTVEPKDRDNPKLTAFRRNLYFPELLYKLGLSPHPSERFLIKIEAQDQGVDYPIVHQAITGCGFFFNFPTAPDSVLLSMKLSALLNRAKGRDFYDVLFLSNLTQPDYHFLQRTAHIKDADSLNDRVNTVLSQINLETKSRDLKHLLFFPEKSGRILEFKSLFKIK